MPRLALPAEKNPRSERETRKVAWLGSSLDLSIASVRYRLIYPAALLEKGGWQCDIFDSARALIKTIQDYDTIVIVKRLDASLIPLVSEANDRGVSVILDFCDDVLDQDYRARSHELFRMVFDAISPRVSAIVTTGDHLKRRFEKYGYSGSIVVIPDCIESEKLKRLGQSFHASKRGARASDTNRTQLLTRVRSALARYYKVVRHPRRSLLNLKRTLHKIRFGDASARRSNVSAQLSDPELQRALGIKGCMVVWFGNHGGPHSDFGLLTLLRCAKELRAAHQETPFTLVILSNHREKWQDLIKPIGIPTHYVSWSGEGTVKLLERANAFVMPTGEDSFSLGKSANRILLALENRTPIVAHALESLDWLPETSDGAALTESLVSILVDRTTARADAISARSRAYGLFNAGSLADLWSETLKSVKPYRKRRDQYGVSFAPEKLLICVNNPTDQFMAMSMYDAANDRGIDVGMIVTKEACHRNPRLAEDLISRRIAPTYMQRSDARRTDFRWLRNATMLFCPSESTHPAHAVPHWLTNLANDAGMRTYTAQHGFRNVGLTDSFDPGVQISSQTIFTWNHPELLPEWVDDEVRLRCVPVGRSKPIVSGAPFEDVIRKKATIGVYENLHWKLYSDDFRRDFVEAIRQIAMNRPSVDIVVIPHPAGLWAIKYMTQTHLPANLRVLNPTTPAMSKTTGLDLLPNFRQIITTPSTIVVDAAQLEMCVGVLVPEKDGFDDYEPLPLLASTDELEHFIKNGKRNYRPRQKRFLESTICQNDEPIEKMFQRMLGIDSGARVQASVVANAALANNLKR